MKKYFQFIAVLGAFLGLVWLKNQMGGNDNPTAGPINTNPVSQPAVSESPGTTSQTNQYKDGTYTGSVEDAYYGSYQVAAVISNRKLSDIQFLQYPNDNQTSISVNDQSMPFLKQEAIQAQSAQVDIVTGASQSSMAFQRSLQAALDQAK